MAPAIASIARVAQAASEPLPAAERARKVLEALRLVVPYDCAELSSWNPVTGSHSALASVGYDARLLDWLNGSDRVSEMDDIDVRTSGQPIRLSDLPARGLAARTVREFLLPAGFRDGLTIGLRTADGRYVGVLDVSSCDARHPSDLEREAITLLAGTLANVVDPTRTVRLLASMLEPGSSAVTIRRRPAEPLEGFSPGPVLSDGHPALRAARRFARCGRAQNFLALGGDESAWFRVQALPLRARRCLGRRGLPDDPAVRAHVARGRRCSRCSQPVARTPRSRPRSSSVHARSARTSSTSSRSSASRRAPEQPRSRPPRDSCCRPPDPGKSYS